MNPDQDVPWWRSTVVHRERPRTFGDGGGIGDLAADHDRVLAFTRRTGPAGQRG
ncbi:hypothetical protein [Pimelobacter simplex]|uniref:hypothetical protein n=1 Tax=Nocardioides simplex TaxID=2045 RepID=UPI0019337B10|nr:hypothetical protein [Pimelobacter simplex]